MKSGHDIIGQYASDTALHADHAGLGDDPYGVKIRGDGNWAMHHEETLFDAVEGTIDETTGRRRVVGAEDHLTEIEGMNIVPDEIALNRRLRSRAAEAVAHNDHESLADQWLAENGYKW